MYEKGYNNFSLRAVAKASGYSPAGLYEYFDSKAALNVVLAEDAWEQLGRLMRRAARSEQDPLKRLVVLCEAYVKYAADNREEFLLLFSLLPTPRDAYDQYVPKRSALAVFLEAITDASALGVINVKTDREKHVAFYGLWTMAHGIAHLQTTHLAEFEDDFSKENHRLFKVLLAGYAQKI